MKFKKGFRVEVCSNEPGFLGAWFGGVIVSQDGLACKVQYDRFVTDERKPLVENMDYNQIRPVPPSTNITNWVVGDAVEAYDNDCWWTGVVVKVLPEKYFSVYFPDSCSEKAYHHSKLRSEQQWHDGRWSLPLQARIQNALEGKSPIVASNRETSLVSSSEEKYMDVRSQSQCNKVEMDVNSKIGLNFQGKIILENSKKANEGVHKHRGLKSGKRAPLLGGLEFSNFFNVRQGVENSGRCRLPNSGKAKQNTFPLIHGSNPPYPDNKPLKRGHVLEERRDTMDEGFPYEESCKDQTYRCSELPQAIDQRQMETTKKFRNSIEARAGSIFFGCSGMDIDGTECSISTTGSCTAFAHASRNKKANMEPKKGRIDHATRSHSTHRKNQKDNNNGLAEEHRLVTHKLELLAYRAVLQAFHAHGSLSWEREVLLTNLRLELHITCDEHTRELEQLTSQL